MAEEVLTREEIFEARKANALIKQQRENEQRGRKRGFTGINEIVDDAQKPDMPSQLQRQKGKILKRKKKDASFGKIYRDMSEVPEFCQLNWRDLRVYLYLAMCRNNSTGIACPGYENILAYLNRCKPDRKKPFDIQSVSRAVRFLEKRGLCRRISKACTGHATEVWVAVKAKDVER